MIPCLKQKIWYAFQGLPFERIDSIDRLPWSKCLVLTNNLMHILQFKLLTEAFKRHVDKSKAEENRGVTFEEYIQFLDKYLQENDKSVESTNQKIRNSNPLFLASVTPPDEQKRLRGNTIESQPSESKFVNLNNYCKSEADVGPLIKSFDDYCWTLFRTKNIPQLSGQSAMNNGFFNLWLLFITYGIKSAETGEVEMPVRMDLLEVRYWCCRIRELFGARRQYDDVDIEENVTGIEFGEFYTMVHDIFKSQCLADSAFNTALQDIAEEALEGVSMKGAIKVDRNTRFCVLKSFFLFIYNSKVSATNLRSCFIISQNSELQAGNNKISIKSPGLTFVTVVTIEISDTQLFNKWRSAFSDAIEFSKSNITNPSIKEAELREESRTVKRSAIKTRRILLEIKLEQERNERCKVTEAMELQLHLADQELCNFKQQMEKELLEKDLLMRQRELLRQEKEAQIKEVLREQQEQYKIQLGKLRDIESEKNCLSEILQVTMEEKSNEEMKRTILEEQHLEAQNRLIEAGEKISSLEKLGEQLEKALEEEKQAKEEEESVRNATLALLDEEYRSKEKLETLLQQQNTMINEEIQKRDMFAQELEFERCRIQSIAEEKEKLTKQLEETRQKMQSTENRVKKLDTKVAQIALNVFGNEQVLLPVSHRGQGFIAEIMMQPQRKKEVIETANSEIIADDIGLPQEST